jgi:hypothetical protein
VRVALYVVHHEHHPVFVRQRVDRALQLLFQVRLGPAGTVSYCVGRVQPHFPLPQPLDLPEPVQDHAHRDRSQPGGKCCLAAELLDLLEGPDERVLREVPSQVLVAGHPVRQPVDPVDVLVVELALRLWLSGADAGDHCLFFHPTPELLGRC